MEKRRFSLQGNYVSIDIGNPGSIPLSEVKDALFDGTPKHIYIKNGHFSLLIPNETLRAINFLSPKIRVGVMAKISHALVDSSLLIIEPEK